jgi:ABC-type Fe3+ transport system substrate-binding protein
LLFVARAAAIGLVLLASEAFAQAAKVPDTAAYAGPDREQRLIAGGRREGSLTLYSNAPTEDNAALVGAFTKKYGIKVNLWRASSEDIRQRALAEARARRFDVDFILNNAPALEALRNENLLQEINSPYLADLMPPALPVPLALTVFNYTAEQLKRKGAPIDWFALAPLVAMPNAVSVLTTAPHPHAAMLFLDFMLSDAQNILAERDYVVSSTRVAATLDRAALKVLNTARVLADGDKWQRLYSGVISSRK